MNETCFLESTKTLLSLNYCLFTYKHKHINKLPEILMKSDLPKQSPPQKLVSHNA